MKNQKEKDALKQKERVDFLDQMLELTNEEIREMEQALKKKKRQQHHIEQQFYEERELLQQYTMQYLNKTQQIQHP